MFVQATTPLALGVYDSHPLPARYTIQSCDTLSLFVLLAVLSRTTEPFPSSFLSSFEKRYQTLSCFSTIKQWKAVQGGGGLGTIGLINDVYPQLMAIGLFLCC